MKCYIFFLPAILIISFGAVGQTIAPEFCMEVQATTGGSAQVQNMHFAWTMGETMIATYSPFLTQGFHQPECGYPYVGIVEPNRLQVQVAPNPTSDFLAFTLTGEQSEREFRCMVRVLDIFGRMALEPVLIDYPIVNVIDCRGLNAGMWLLRLDDLDSGKSAILTFIKAE